MDTPIEDSNLAHIGSEEDAAARKVTYIYYIFLHQSLSTKDE